MTLSVRPVPYLVPTYSLTGDLLAFLNCGLQYRYHNLGSLPPSKPVQMWFGQFIHGVMEEAYRVWLHDTLPFPWTDQEILPITDLIVRRLAARGLHYQRRELLEIALERARLSINVWGAHLFPLITEAEVRLKGIRPMPANTTTIRQSNYYEVEGVVDVLTSIQLNAFLNPNPIVLALASTLDTETYEIIVDYKGMRRPRLNDPSWVHHEWQLHTYAWLREQQRNTNPVRMAVLLYLNELLPSVEDMDVLFDEIDGNQPPQSDVLPSTIDLRALQEWPRRKREWQEQMRNWRRQRHDWYTRGRNSGELEPRMPIMPQTLSLEYRQRRSIRIVEIDTRMVGSSLERFDDVVSRIEGHVTQESQGQPLTHTWPANPNVRTCVVCDFKTFCPDSPYQGPPSAP